MRNFYARLKLGYVFAPSLALLFFAGLYCQPTAAQSCPINSTVNQFGSPNTYFPASQANVPAGSTSIGLGASVFGSLPIKPGDILLIIQMQGAQINSSNSNSYGDGSGTASGYLNNGQLLAGNMEYVVASNNVPLAGGTLNITTGLVKSYQNTPFGTDGQYTYQVIRVPVFYDLQIGGTMTAPRWDGSSGGVIVLYATNNILMNSQTIDASGRGFRGGGGRYFGGAGSGANTDYITMSSSNANGSKGEGIAGTPKYTYNTSGVLNTAASEGYPNGSYAMGAPGNAGGGGTDGNPASANDQNTGGGGGSNGGYGGSGGRSWNTGLYVGGKPGAPFAQVSASQLVMGGGGGAGTTNNATGTPNNGLASSGAAGGGIVILMANAITGTGTILANGTSAFATVVNDGSGGGGAGGSILIYSNNGITSNITAQAIGGNGGSNELTGTDPHGPGGGAGGGVVYSNSTLNGASSVAGGIAGTTNSQSTNYGATDGNAGAMVTNMNQAAPAQVPLHCVVLPVSFLNVSAVTDNNSTTLNWEVAQGINTFQYIVERSLDGINFSAIGTVSLNKGNEYRYTDNALPATGGTLYYRIREVETDGQYVYSKVVSVKLNNLSSTLSVYPNPARTSVTVSFSCTRAALVSLRLFDLKGSQVWEQQYRASAGQNSLVIDHISQLPAGVYILQWFDGLKPEQVKIMVNH